MLGLALLAPWFWWMHVARLCGLPKGRAKVAVFVRMLFCSDCSHWCWPNPRAVRTNDTLSVVFALDVSARFTVLMMRSVHHRDRAEPAVPREQGRAKLIISAISRGGIATDEELSAGSLELAD